MKRRNFITRNMALGAMIPGAYASMGFTDNDSARENGRTMGENDIFVEKLMEGQPHKGKVLAVIQPHNDDIPLFAAGTVAKLIYEGYTGYLIRTSNDEAAGKGN